MTYLAELIYYTVYQATSKGAARQDRIRLFINIMFFCLAVVCLLNAAAYLRLFKPNVAFLAFLVGSPWLSLKMIDKYYSNRHWPIIRKYQHLDRFKLWFRIGVYLVFFLTVILFVASGIRWGRASVQA